MKAEFKRAIAAILLVLSFATSVAAGPLEDATAAYARGDYATALRFIRPQADQGNAKAQYNLGLMYDKGQGVPQNFAEALKWYRLAALQGHAGARNNIANIYDEGRGIRQNYAAAMKWYRLAAEQGDAEAQFNLGALYAKGRGAPQDYVSAHMWFNLAAAQGRHEAETKRDDLAKLMTSAQIAEAQKLAREWKPTKRPPQ